MHKRKKAAASQVAAESSCVVIQTSAPKPRRIQATPSRSIKEKKMAIVRGLSAWFGKVRPVDSRRILFKRAGEKYILDEGEFDLFDLS